ELSYPRRKQQTATQRAGNRERDKIMNRKITRHNLIAKLAALALLAFCLVQLNVHARAQETHTIIFSKLMVEHGQTLQLNLTYAVDPTQSSQLPPAIRAFAQFKDTSGNTIYISTAGGGVWKTVNGGQSWSFEVNRDQLP